MATRYKNKKDNKKTNVEYPEEESRITPAGRLIALILILAMVLFTFIAAGLFWLN